MCMKDFGAYKEIGFSSADSIKSVQQRLLRKHITYCKEHSPFYQSVFKKYNINPRKIGLDNLCDIPFTDKADIENDNDAFLAISPEKIEDTVFSSGTTGKSIKISYTELDLSRLAYNEEKSFLACGFDDKDVVLLTCTLDRCFVAGLAYYLGVRAVGATAIRNGLNTLESHAEVIQRIRPTAIVGVPSFIRKLGFFLDEEKMTVRKENVSKLVCIGEPLRGEKLESLKMAVDIEETWGAKAYSTYSSSEIVTTFCECAAQTGGHLHPDLAVVEIVDEKGIVLGPREKGEVVVTPMRVEGMPLVRFKTGDISFIIDEPCSCGRYTLRLGPILGRKKQMMKVAGTTIYPQAIYSVLEEIDGVKGYYITASSKNELSDAVEVYLAAEGSGCTVETIQNKLQARIRFKPRVFIRDEEFIKGQVYSQKSRKPTRFIDKRIK
ncbi:MAG: AMP-binding protein [Candidatus Omnitrophica bacterium]|nr:AMP-binding protein [Candidatus Omnitrophota bacterium]